MEALWKEMFNLTEPEVFLQKDRKDRVGFQEDCAQIKYSCGLTFSRREYINKQSDRQTLPTILSPCSTVYNNPFGMLGSAEGL